MLLPRDAALLGHQVVARILRSSIRIRQHTSAYAYVSIRQHTHKPAFVSIRQHTSAYYVSIRQHTSAYVSRVVAGILRSTSVCPDVCVSECPQQRLMPAAPNASSA